MAKPLVMAVGQDTNQLSRIKTFLKKEKYKVQLAENSKDALVSLGKNKTSIVISDENIPANGGLDFLRIVKHRYPQTVRCLICSEIDSPSIRLSLKNKEICTVLKKPWKEEDLLSNIQDCVERLETSEANRESMGFILSAYQKTDSSREEDLELSSAILNVLPQAAIVLDEDFHVIISNDIFNLKIAAELHNKDLPEELRDLLQNRMQTHWSDFRFQYDLNKSKYGIRVRPLRNTDSKRAIIFFDLVNTSHNKSA